MSHPRRWEEWLRRRGFPTVAPLAAGAEGVVYRLGDGRVAKVWGRRRAPELLDLQRFYADVALAGLPFATPVIETVEEVDGVAVTVERELPGRSLQRLLDRDAEEIDPVFVDAVTGVLAALAQVEATEAMRNPDPDDFPTALVGLLHRRVARSGDLLRAAVPDFDARFARLVERLAALDRVPSTILHGDLFGENVLVDAAGRPLAVLDFAFGSSHSLSTAGDPRLDVAISAAVVDMYGPHAARRTTVLTARWAALFGHPVAVLRCYRAAYAVATSTAFAADGRDGHFAWCAAVLRSAEIDEALGLSR